MRLRVKGTNYTYATEGFRQFKDLATLYRLPAPSERGSNAPNEIASSQERHHHNKPVVRLHIVVEVVLPLLSRLHPIAWPSPDRYGKRYGSAPAGLSLSHRDPCAGCTVSSTTLTESGAPSPYGYLSRQDRDIDQRSYVDK